MDEGARGREADRWAALIGHCEDRWTRIERQSQDSIAQFMSQLDSERESRERLAAANHAILERVTEELRVERECRTRETAEYRTALERADKTNQLLHEVLERMMRTIVLSRTKITLAIIGAIGGGGALAVGLMRLLGALTSHVPVPIPFVVP